MPKFKVQFPHAVRYQPDHPKGYETTVLTVNAPTAQAALIHAIRVVTGDVGEPVVTLDDTIPEAPVDA